MNQPNQPDKKNEPQATKNPREIEASIEDTRSALTDDIKALSDNASPSHLKQEAKQAVKQAKDNLVEKAVDKGVEVKNEVVEKALELKDVAKEKASEARDVALTKAHEAGEVISETASEIARESQHVGQVAWRFTVANAVPLGLIGIGAGWLLSNRRSSTSSLPRRRYEPDYLEDYPADNLAFAADTEYPAYAYPAGDGAGATRRSTAGQRSALKNAGSRLRENGKRAYDKAEQGLEAAEHSIATTAAHSRDAVQDQLRRAQQASRQLVEANPLAFAFGTLIAGVGLGLLLPSTAREDRWLEPTRTRIRGAVGKARDTAEDLGHVAKQTAQETVAHASGRADVR